MSLEQRTTALAEAMGADVKALREADGDLSALATKEKGSLVGALNEVHTLVGGSGRNIDGGSSSSVYLPSQAIDGGGASG